MAKSFKQLTAQPQPQKRTSEKDILDFLEQDQDQQADGLTGQNASQQASSVNNTSNTARTNRKRKPSMNTLSVGKDVTDNTNATGVTSITSVSNDTHVTNVAPEEEEDRDVRQTFIIGQQYLDKLKDYVHTKRITGQYEYTQKQALHDALDKLFKGASIEIRPDHIRQQEETRKQRIRKGIPGK